VTNFAPLMKNRKHNRRHWSFLYAVIWPMVSAQQQTANVKNVKKTLHTLMKQYQTKHPSERGKPELTQLQNIASYFNVQIVLYSWNTRKRLTSPSFTDKRTTRQITLNPETDLFESINRPDMFTTGGKHECTWCRHLFENLSNLHRHFERCRHRTFCLDKNIQPGIDVQPPPDVVHKTGQWQSKITVFERLKRLGYCLHPAQERSLYRHLAAIWDTETLGQPFGHRDQPDLAVQQQVNTQLLARHQIAYIVSLFISLIGLVAR
jgi:hypothetical protein